MGEINARQQKMTTRGAEYSGRWTITRAYLKSWGDRVKIFDWMSFHSNNYRHCTGHSTEPDVI